MFSSVQFSHSVMSDSLQPHEPQHRQAFLSITSSWSPTKPMSIELVMPSIYLILCCPLLLLPSIFPSIKVFSNESVLPIRWPKYCSFGFNISSSNEHKASGGDGISGELFQILKDDAVKVLHLMSANLENSTVATGLEKVHFHSNPK